MADGDYGDDTDEQPQAIYPNTGPDREEMISQYLPEQDEWEAKTRMDLSDPAAVAALANIGQMYPEVDDLQPLVDGFLEHFLRSRTSVHGEAREDFRDMFISMFGGGPRERNESKMMKLVAADDDD